MRVTQNTAYGTLKDTLHRTKSRMETYQNQASTLKKLNTPSDDPVGSSKVMEIRTDKVNNSQFERNAKTAEAFLSNSDHALNEMTDLLLRAKEIAIGQASGASSTDESRLGVAEEVSQLYQTAVSLANTRIGERYLFGGYKTDRPPVSPEGKYQGDKGQMMVEIGKDVFISMNIPGYEIFNTQPEGSGDAIRLLPRSEDGEPVRAPANEDMTKGKEAQNYNLFNELQNLRISLLTGDLDGIRGTMNRFDQIHANIVANRSRIGSRVNGLQGSIRAMQRHNLTNAELSSSIEDADMVEVMNNLAKEETIFRTALSSSQRLVQPTLVDFLR